MWFVSNNLGFVFDEQFTVLPADARRFPFSGESNSSTSIGVSPPIYLFQLAIYMRRSDPGEVPVADLRTTRRWRRAAPAHFFDGSKIGVEAACASPGATRRFNMRGRKVASQLTNCIRRARRTRSIQFLRPSGRRLVVLRGQTDVLTMLVRSSVWHSGGAADAR